LPTSSARRLGILTSLLLLSIPGHGGEIPGLPLPTLPDIPRAAQLTLGNDLLAGFDDILDDFRTQQLVFDGRIGERWSVAVDHSVMTFEAPGFQDDWGRLDQLSASFGYDFLRPADGNDGLTLSAGAGLRSVSNFGGAEIQNGVHRLVDDRIVRLPYVETQRTDATAWLRAQASAPLPWQNLRDLFGSDWQLGYWWHGTALATTDGQWDGVAAAHLTATRGWFNVWLGLRGDWRRGYDRDPVQAAVADNEETGYLVIGLRFGPLIIETQQSSESDKGYGRISLLADIAPASRRLKPGREFSLLFGVTAPQVYAQLQGRTEFCGWFNCTESRRWRLLGDLRFGDVDGDGRTDVFHGTANGDWLYAPGGSKGWLRLGSARLPAEELFLGDADGDEQADVVHLSPKGSWRVFSSARRQWLPASRLAAPPAQLRFADVDGNQRLDLLRLQSIKAQPALSYAALTDTAWRSLRSAIASLPGPPAEDVADGAPAEPDPVATTPEPDPVASTPEPEPDPAPDPDLSDSGTGGSSGGGGSTGGRGSSVATRGSGCRVQPVQIRSCGGLGLPPRILARRINRLQQHAPLDCCAAIASEQARVDAGCALIDPTQRERWGCRP